MFNNFKIRRKIAVLAVMMAMSIIVVGAMGVYDLSKSNEKMSSMYNEKLKSIQYLEENRAHARAVLSEIFRLILLSGDSTAQESVKAKIEERANDFNANYEKFKALPQDAEEKALEKELESNLATYREGRTKVIDLAMAGKRDEAFQSFSEVEKPAEAFLQNLISLTEYSIKQAEALKNDNDTQYADTIKIFVGLILGSLLFAAFITWFISRAITKPISIAIEHIGEVANYDIRSDMPEVYKTRKDEVGDLARMIQKIQDNLRVLIRSISETSEQVAASSEELTATSQQAAAAANEVAKAIDEIAQGATSQAESTTDGAEKLLELGEMIEEDKKNIAILNGSSQQVDVLVNAGLTIINELSVKTVESEEATKSVFQSILKTDESSNKISEASGLITSIAQQTNLLALNASIEAARAGEHGKGFAVVANEIKDLAEQSSSSTKIIDAMVHNLQKDSKDAVDIMKQVITILKEQRAHVENSDSKYREISEAIEKSVQAVDVINHTSVIMENKKNEVLDTIQSLSAVAEENAAGTEEASSSIEEQTTSMEEIANSSESLSLLAQELYTLINKFKM